MLRLWVMAVTLVGGGRQWAVGGGTVLPVQVVMQIVVLRMVEGGWWTQMGTELEWMDGG